MIFLVLKTSCQIDAPAMGSGRAASSVGQICSRNFESPSAWVEWDSHATGEAAWKEDELEDVSCQKGSLFQVCVSPTSFSHLQKPSELCIVSKGCENQLVKKTPLLPAQGNLFIPCILTSASHLRKQGLGLS